MSYNYRKEYAKWKRWKEQEERILKQMKMIGHSSMTKDVLLGNKTLQTINILH